MPHNDQQHRMSGHDRDREDRSGQGGYYTQGTGGIGSVAPGGSYLGGGGQYGQGQYS